MCAIHLIEPFFASSWQFASHPLKQHKVPLFSLFISHSLSLSGGKTFATQSRGPFITFLTGCSVAKLSPTLNWMCYHLLLLLLLPPLPEEMCSLCEVVFAGMCWLAGVCIQWGGKWSKRDWIRSDWPRSPTNGKMAGMWTFSPLFRSP